jgi:hypothetical protein
MLAMDFVPVCRSADRGCLRAVTDALRRAGISWALLPSDRAVAAWDIEVSADDAEAARRVIESEGLP